MPRRAGGPAVAYAPPPRAPLGNGGLGAGAPPYVRTPPTPQLPLSKSRRLYVGNIPFHVGLGEAALQQFFSALYVAGFRPCRPAEPLPVLSVWLHADGKFGFMELRGDQEAVNMMLLNGVFLHGRPLRINRPSDYRPEIHNPAAAALVAESINFSAVVTLCDQLDGLAAPPAQLRSVILAGGAISADARPTAAPSTPPTTASAPVASTAPVSSPAAVRASVSPSAPPPPPPPPPPPAANGAANGASPPPRPTARPALALRSAPSPLPPARPTNGHAKGIVGTVDAPSETGKHPAADAMLDEEKPQPNGNGSSRVTGDTSNVISLVNLVTNNDLEGSDAVYQEVFEDVEEECGQYGEVKKVEIPRTGVWKGTALIQFSKNEEAQTAVEALRKRVFDGRQIKAEFVMGCSSATEALSFEPVRTAE